MYKLLIVTAVALIGWFCFFFLYPFPTVEAVGNAGYRLDGTYDESAIRKSRPSVTIKVTSCANTGIYRRSMSERNWQRKCLTNQRRRRQGRSAILQQYATIYRPSVKITVAKKGNTRIRRGGFKKDYNSVFANRSR